MSIAGSGQCPPCKPGKMAKIFYLPDGKEVDTDTHKSILETSCQSKIPHTSACGGDGLCSTCRVMVLEGVESCSPRTDKEKIIAERLHFDPTIRLACQTKITGDVKLRRLVLDEEDIELTSQAKSGGKASIAGKLKHLAILFADIRGFTPFAETMVPYDLIHFLNRYFHQMGHVISLNDGFIDNYMGDGLLALFGVDKSDNAPFRAVKAGLEMIDEMESLNNYLEALYKKTLVMNVGIHYGEVVVGTVGSSGHKVKTVIGDAVNLASRVESANKEMGTKLLISDDLFKEVREDVEVNRQAEINMRGKSGRHKIYEVVGISVPKS